MLTLCPSADKPGKITVLGHGIQFIAIHRCFHMLSRFVSQAVGGLQTAQDAAEESGVEHLASAISALERDYQKAKRAATSADQTKIADKGAWLPLEVHLSNVLAIVPQRSDNANLFCIAVPTMTVVPQASNDWLSKLLDMLRSRCVTANHARATRLT